jgi:hypothetical protein
MVPELPGQGRGLTSSVMVPLLPRQRGGSEHQHSDDSFISGAGGNTSTVMVSSLMGQGGGGQHQPSAKTVVFQAELGEGRDQCCCGQSSRGHPKEC